MKKEQNKIIFYNTLTKRAEEFKPIKKGQVGMYTCGPTVYWYQHIGNLRTAILYDLIKRTFTYSGYKVKHVMNITDVDDKTIKGSKKENIPLTQLTRKYEDIFLKDLSELNIIKPNIVIRATDSIKEMIELIQKLIKKGFAYKSSDGIYYDVSKFRKYGKLAGLEKIKKTKSRTGNDEYDKSNIQDFALWKFWTEEDGDIFWETPLGKGRPGWHIECSAMAIKYLGNHFDIHSGAQDLIFPHHTNEIAQSEAATGKKFVNLWIHGAFLNMKESKMSKSLGNIITLKEVKDSGYKPIHFRYLCLQTHYRKPLNFSFENLEATKSGYERIKRKIIELKITIHKGIDKTRKYDSDFQRAIDNDLNIPLALQIFNKTLEDIEFDSKKRLKLLEKFDKVLGLNIKKIKEEKTNIPEEVSKMLEAREEARSKKMWAEADILRERIKERGYIIQDTPEGPKIELIS